MASNPIVPISDRAAARERNLEALRSADLDALKEMAKNTYAQIAAIRTRLEPFEEDHSLALQVIQEKLLAEERTVVNDPDYYIGFELTKGSAQKNDAAIYESLRSLTIDGDPLPVDEIQKAAWVEPPPPPPPAVVKTNLTHLKTLAKTYGKSVQAIIDAHVFYPPPGKRFVFKPKERNVTDNGKPALPDKN